VSYPKSRSCNGALHAGMVDGSYKQVAPNRGGFVEGTTYEVRKLFSDIWYGFHEVNPKALPDGRFVDTAYFEPNKEAQISV
jgi:hypothetical protein